MERVFNALPDVPDFRDQLYQATLVEVPTSRSLDDYRKSVRAAIPILDQGSEGACTGYALAAVAHYLLRGRRDEPAKDFNLIEVSPLMLYAMAKRYDEWPGEKYSGSSARGAMKAWHKHGVCALSAWKAGNQAISSAQAEDARKRPLGAYYRVNHRDLVSMHAAIAEVGVLYATASVHEGWSDVGSGGEIRLQPGSIGGHAFAIVGYDQKGFWIQNSWGSSWGKGGFGHISYDDWLLNGSDVWVARLGVPLTLSTAGTVGTQAVGSSHSKSYGFGDLRAHIVSIGNDGRLRETGTYGTGEADVREIVDEIIRTVARWERPRILLYAHGGLVSEESAVQKVAQLRSDLVEQQVYPVSFIWKTDYLTTLKNILEDASRRRRPEGVLDATREFMFDRVDDLLETLARKFTGRAEWSEMKENALLATSSKQGGVRYFVNELTRRVDPGTQKRYPFEFHLVGHSAGSIVHAALAQYLATRGPITGGPLDGQSGLGRRLSSCTLWAPACTMELFEKTYAPLAEAQRLGDFSVFALSDPVEQGDDCARIYHKSLLYLVAHAFEERARMPLIRPDGTPLLGMEKFLARSQRVAALQAAGRMRVVYSPNANPLGEKDASRSRTHGGFDDDEATLRATLASVLGQSAVAAVEESEQVAIRMKRSNFDRGWLAAV